MVSAYALLKLANWRSQRFSYLNTMRAALADCRTCLDVGCGNESPLRHYDFAYSVGVDGHAPALNEARRLNTHHDYRLTNVMELEKHFSPKQFDCCVALDLLEHLTKEDGLRFLASMERIAAKKVVIFTPNGFLPQQAYNSNELQEHRSGWTAEEMRGLGYNVYGMYGPKILRGEYHRHRLKPAALWGVIAAGAHFSYTKWKPKSAAAILCVKSTTELHRN
jgi:hypothetical protein